MDHVPSKQRAKWKSLESVSSFGWCGSAALGGYLADQPGVGYTGTFMYTAMIQGCAVLLQAMLLFVVPLYEKEKPEAEAATSSNTSSVEPLPTRPSTLTLSPSKADSGGRNRSSAGEAPATPDGSIN